MDSDELIQSKLGEMLLSSTLVAEVESYRETHEALNSIPFGPPAVVFLGSRANAPDATQVIRSLKAACPDTALIVHVPEGEHEDLLSWFLAGAIGFINWPTTDQVIKTALSRVTSGGYYFPGAASDVLLRALQSAALRFSQNTDLTSREWDIFGRLAQGLADKQIAVELGLATGTVHRHVSAILKKLNVHKRAAAVRCLLSVPSDGSPF